MTKDIAKNEFNVPKRQWSKWTNLGRNVFNKTYAMMLDDQEVFTHPATTVWGGIPDEEWKTICWNAAFISADIASRGSKHLVKDLKEIV